MSQNNDLQGTILSIIASANTELYTSLPAYVKKFDEIKQTVDVILGTNLKRASGDVLEGTTITDVPVVFPSSSESVIYIPLKVNDMVILEFTMYPLDVVIDSSSKGVPLTPDTMRYHDMCDVVAKVGLFKRAAPPVRKKLSKDLHIAFKQSFLSIAPDGVITLDTPSNVVVNALGDITANAEGKVTVNSPETTINSPTITLNGDVTITGTTHSVGNVTSDANITAVGVVTDSGAVLATHTHKGDSGGNTSPPQ